MGVSHLLRRIVQIRPHDTALVFGHRRQSWAEFHDRVRRLAGGLQSLGVGPNDRVALLMINNDRHVETMVGAPWAGGVVVNLNYRWSVAELGEAIDDCTPKVLMLDDANLEAGLKLAEGRTHRMKLVYAGDSTCPKGMVAYEKLVDEFAPAQDAGRTGDDLFTILYTGGTTGHSKGVMLSHANQISCSLSSIADGLFTEKAVYLTAMPMFHAGGIWPFISCMASGARTVLVPGFQPEQALEIIQRERVTEALLVPTMIQMLIEHPLFKQYDTSSFTTIIYGASPITEALLDRAIVAFPQSRFIQCYGMTELSPLACVLHNDNLHGEPRQRGRHRAAGRSTYAVEVEIVDENDRPVPRGTVGEIVARGPNVMLGYWNKPEQTAEAKRNGWMHTGDGGYMDEDGYVYVVDRVKDMIISGGENIYSIEVENAIAQHPAVRQCAVIGIPSKEWIETVHAIIVPNPGHVVSADEIIEHCRARIARYKCPRSVEFRDEPLPLSHANKILKRELRAEYLKKHGIVANAVSVA
jgi:long-chain acyl-CoA synthetase